MTNKCLESERLFAQRQFKRAWRQSQQILASSTSHSHYSDDISPPCQNSSHCTIFLTVRCIPAHADRDGVTVSNTYQTVPSFPIPMDDSGESQAPQIKCMTVSLSPIGFDHCKYNFSSGVASHYDRAAAICLQSSYELYKLRLNRQSQRRFQLKSPSHNNDIHERMQNFWKRTLQPFWDAYTYTYTHRPTRNNSKTSTTDTNTISIHTTPPHTLSLPLFYIWLRLCHTMKWHNVVLSISHDILLGIISHYYLYLLHHSYPSSYQYELDKYPAETSTDIDTNVINTTFTIHHYFHKILYTFLVDTLPYVTDANTIQPLLLQLRNSFQDIFQLQQKQKQKQNKKQAPIHKTPFIYYPPPKQPNLHHVSFASHAQENTLRIILDSIKDVVMAIEQKETEEDDNDHNINLVIHDHSKNIKNGTILPPSYLYHSYSHISHSLLECFDKLQHQLNTIQQSKREQNKHNDKNKQPNPSDKTTTSTTVTTITSTKILSKMVHSLCNKTWTKIPNEKENATANDWYNSNSTNQKPSLLQDMQNILIKSIWNSDDRWIHRIRVVAAAFLCHYLWKKRRPMVQNGTQAVVTLTKFFSLPIREVVRSLRIEDT